MYDYVFELIFYQHDRSELFKQLDAMTTQHTSVGRADARLRMLGSAEAVAAADDIAAALARLDYEARNYGVFLKSHQGRALETLVKDLKPLEASIASFIDTVRHELNK